MSPLPVDPVTVAKVGATVVRAVWPVGVRAWDTHAAHQAIGEIVPEVLALAVCPDDPDHPTARAAAVAIHDRLRHTPIKAESGRKPGRFRRLAQKVGGRFGHERAPKVALFGETDFHHLLWQWVRDAMRDDPKVAAALKDVRCRDPELHGAAEPDNVAVYFPGMFTRVLATSKKGSAWRTGLLDSLIRAEANREALTTLVGWTNLLFGPSGSALGAIGGAQLAGASDHTTLLAALGAAGITVPAQLAAAWRQRAKREKISSPMGAAIRGEVATWIEDLLAEQGANGDTQHSRPPTARIARLHQADRPLIVSPPKLTHLELLTTRAAQAGEEEFSIDLFQLHSALARAAHTPKGKDPALMALHRVAERVDEAWEEPGGEAQP